MIRSSISFAVVTNESGGNLKTSPNALLEEWREVNTEAPQSIASIGIRSLPTNFQSITYLVRAIMLTSVFLLNLDTKTKLFEFMGANYYQPESVYGLLTFDALFCRKWKWTDVRTNHRNISPVMTGPRVVPYELAPYWTFFWAASAENPYEDRSVTKPTTPSSFWKHHNIGADRVGWKSFWYLGNVRVLLNEMRVYTTRKHAHIHVH
jgi:hypothetical protein